MPDGAFEVYFRGTCDYVWHVIGNLREETLRCQHLEEVGAAAWG